MTTMLKIGCAALAAATVLLCRAPWGDVPIPAATDTTIGAPATAADTNAAVRDTATLRQAPPPPEAPAPVALRGQLVGLVDGIRWQPRIEIRAKGRVDDAWLEQEVLAVADPTGAFSFELPGWVRQARVLDLRLGASASDPYYDCQGARFDAEVLRRHDPLAVPVKAIAKLMGRVVDDSGIGIPAAQVCAYFALQGLPQGPMLACCNTDSDGHYTLRAPAEGELVLLALPMEPAQLSGMRLQLENGAIMDTGQPRTDLLPLAVSVRAGYGQPTQVPEHRLPAPSPVTVTVVMPAGVPIEAAQLSVGYPEDHQELPTRSAYRAQVWSLDRCAIVPSDLRLERGTTVLRLPAGVRVQLRPRALHDSLLSCFASPETEVAAPASCTLTLKGSLRTLTARRRGVPVPGAQVDVPMHPRTYSTSTDARGRCQLLLDDMPHTVTVQAFGGTPVRVHLTPEQPDPIFVEVSTTDEAPLTIATRSRLPVLAMTLEFHSQSSPGPPRTEHLRRSDPTRPFVVDLPIGTYRIVMSAPSDGSTPDAFLVSNWRHVTVESSGSTEDWTVEHGGRSRVEFQGRIGLALAEPLQLRRRGFETAQLTANEDPTTWLSPILSPGDYTLQQRGGFALAIVHITALQTSTIRVRLP
ncbi:MAG: hypothetical protein H6838_06280 [Planctomycetes bacterium]|nr:hypothetical protein [Planctomycetota bacterium]